MNKVLLYAAISLFFQQALGQHVVDFSIQNEVCLGEELQIQNSSDEGLAVEWDFCAAQLEGAYTTETRGSVTAFMTDISIVSDNGSWYGFAISRSNLLYKIHYGNSPANPPDLIESLGNPGGLLNSPEGIDVLKDGNDWYAFITNIGNDIIRVYWENSLEIVPTAEKLNLTSYNKLNGPVQIEVVKDNDVFVAVVANVFSSTITLVRFGTSLNNFPVDTDVIESVRLPNAFDTYGVTIVRECSEWVAFAISSGRIYKIEIGMELFSPISIDKISDFTNDLPIAIGSYNHIRSTIEGETTYVFFTSYTGRNIGAAIWRRGASNAEYMEIDDTFTFSPYGLDIYKNEGNYGIILSGYDTGVLNHISITSPCSASTRLFNKTPRVISYSEPGTYTISLKVTFSDGVVCSKTHDLIVNSMQAPAIDILATNECVLSPVNFEALNNGDITDYNWDFGDTNTSTDQDPTHQYTAVGDYDVVLQVTASNGCNNLARQTVTIYNEPVADFDLPSASPICTNQDYLFANTTSFDVGSNPTWQWEVNGTPTSTIEDLTYEIPMATMQDIKLIATIPGCSSEITKTINTVEDGPLANFTFTNDCEDKSITFTNTTVGTVTGYSWDFGDGNTSGLTNGTNTFDDFGTYDVTLEATNAAGCINTSVQEITIYSKPQPDFSLDLPPFSCSGSPSQFNDLTPNPTDSNLDSWAWSFGDAQSGTAISRNPQYTYTDAAQYNVNLDVTTNFGCTASVQKMVTISQTPDANFSFNAACINQATSFTPLSTSGIDSWQWKIGTSTYNQQNPTHVFSNSSTYNVQLTANGTNGCIGVASQTVKVPVPSTVDFGFENNCTGQETQFTDLTNSGADPVISRLWQFGSIGSATGATPSFTFPSAGAYPTKLTVTNESGCSYSTTKIVNIAQSPVATFTATPQTGTPPLTVQLSNTSASSISQLWSVNDSNNSSSTKKTASFTFDKLGEYVVDLTVEDESGCTTVSSKIISVIIPALDIELTHLSVMPTATGESNILLSLTNKSNFPVNNIKAVIDISGEALISETITATIQPNEVYSQILSVGIIGSKNGTTYLCVELVVDGDANIQNNKKCLNNDVGTVVMAPYPNPVSENLTLEWISAAAGSAEIHIFDPTGRKVYEDMFVDLEPGLNQASISVSLLNPGMYYVFFVSEGIQRSFPFVIRR